MALQVTATRHSYFSVRCPCGRDNVERPRVGLSSLIEGAASRAHHRRVRDFSAHHNRLTAPMPFRAGLFAGALGGLVLVRLAGFLGRSVGRIGGGAVHVGRNRLASLFTPIGVVARRRTRTGRKSSPARLANKRANSCNRQANSSSCSRDIPARSERLISFSSGANRRGTSSVESHSRQSASPLTTIRPRPSPPHPIDLRGDVNGYSGEDWIPVSYEALYDALCSNGGSNSPYVCDLRAALGRLLAVAAAARSDPGVAAHAFHDNRVSPTSLTAYVEEMRLAQLVQRIWMSELAARLRVPPTWRTSIGESHGEALINVEAEYPNGFLIGMQLQRRTLKAFCQPHPYLPEATPHQHREIERILQIIRSSLDIGQHVTPSSSRDCGFRSFAVANLPPGRQLDGWVAELRPKLDRLYSAFPQAQKASA